jgi:XTP/dITP diphosphohydrolase
MLSISSALLNNAAMKLVIATKNRNKIVEIKNKLHDLGHVEISSLLDFVNPPEILEDGTTFEENAIKKAVTIARYSDLPVMADDSGLVVDILGGEPGVRSARYGGPGLDDTGRNKLLLKRLAGIPVDRRSARFVCVIALALPDGTCRTVEGTCEGLIIEEMRGAAGFGYDPLFLIPELAKTMAELTLEEKNRISHRARALDLAKEILKRMDNMH